MFVHRLAASKEHRIELGGSHSEFVMVDFAALAAPASINRLRAVPSSSKSA